MSGSAAEKRPVRLIDLDDDYLATLVSQAVERGVERALQLAGVTAQRDAEEFTTAQAAKLLGISPGALRHHVSRGHLKPESRGGKRGLRSSRFSRATLEAFRRRTNGDED